MSTESDEKHADIVDRAVRKIEQAFELRPEAERALAKVRATEAAWRWVPRVSLLEAMILLVLARAGPRPGVERPINQRTAALALGAHRGTINRALQRLETRGLLESTDPTGRPKTYALRFLEIDPRPDDDTTGGILQPERLPPPKSMEELLIELVLDLSELMEEEINRVDHPVRSST